MAAQQPASGNLDWPSDMVIAAMDRNAQRRLCWRARQAYDNQLIGEDDFERILLATGPASDRELAQLEKQIDQDCLHLEKLRWIILAGFFVLLFLLTITSSLLP